MKTAKSILAPLLTILFVWTMNKSWQTGAVRIPPPGKFLDPFHGFWQNMESATPQLPESLHLNVEQPVIIAWDSLLIPHIFAGHEQDLYFAQGYVTAMHRLWQMEFQTHAAAGRLSEILGPGQNNTILDYDRQQRRLGVTLAAENALKGMEKNPIASRIISAYTAGVNSYISSLRYNNLPLEYKILDYQPELWTNLKTALLLRSMAQTLNMRDKDVEMTNAVRLFGLELANLLFPDHEEVGDAIVEKPGKWNFNPAAAKGTIAFPDGKGKSYGAFSDESIMASNNWAVSGNKTASGFPILCNDPHLNTTLPSIWYAVHLNAPGVNTMGVSLPGAPGVIIGFNDSIAWGVTNAQRDLTDWYRITFYNQKREKYLLDNQWVDAERRIETFKIRGQPELHDTVLYTFWGPVVYDENFKPHNNRKNLAFRWISHDESEEALTFYYLNRAHNYNDFMKALDYYSSPAQNFIFASARGDIAIRIQGKFPIRNKDEGRFVLDGSQSTAGPSGYIPFTHNIMDKNPERGFVSSANQYPADSTYPYYITASSYEAYRNRRINNRLREMSHISVDDLMQLQNDSYSIKAEEVLPLMLKALHDAELNTEEKHVAEILGQWNFHYDASLAAPCYFEAWWNNLYNMIWDEMHNDTLDLPLPTSFTTISLMKKQRAPEFFDDRKTPEKETLNDLIVLAYRKALVEVEKWRAGHPAEPLQWANYKDTYVEHLLRQEAFSRHVLHGGHANTVNASSRKHGPSWRMVVSLGPANVQAYAVYPGGQSGNPGSAYYDNLLLHWANGRYFRLSFYRNPYEAGKSTLFVTTLYPRL